MAPVIIPASLTLDKPITRIPFSQNMDLRVSLNPCPIFTRTVPHAADRSHARTALIPASKHLLPLDPPTPHQGRVGSGQCNGCIFLDCARRPPSAASVRLVIQRRFPNHLPVLRSLTTGNMNPPKELAGVKIAYGGV